MRGPGLLLLLTACCPRLAAQEPAAPIGNLRVELDSRKLTWDVLGNLSGIECSKGTSIFRMAYDDKHCHFETMSLCSVTNYSVRVTQPPFSTWILFPEPGLRAEAAARALQCEIADAGPMVCSWAAGAGAPADVRYRLSWADVRSARQGRCPRYRRDARGRNVGCRLDGVRALPSFVTVTVSGTSDAGPVPCADLSVELAGAETLFPPNISTECNGTHAHMTWPPPRSHFQSNFKYELQTRQVPGGALAPIHSVRTNEFYLPNPGTYEVRIRACYRSNRWTAWGPLRTFECGPAESTSTRLWWTSVLGALGALGALVLVMLAVLLCRRYSLPRRLFPPLPSMKDPLGDPGNDLQLMPQEAGPEDCPLSEVQVLQREP